MSAKTRNDDIAFCLDLIGKPWVSGARGPDVFDCWGLLVHAYRERRGITLSPYPGLDAKDTLAVARVAADESLSLWQPVLNPVHFGAVGMSTNKRIHHVGLWLDIDGGGVFHCFDGVGVIFQPLTSLRLSGIQNVYHFKYKV